VCAPTQRKPFELIVIKTHTRHLLARAPGTDPNAQTSHCQDYWGALHSSWIAKSPPELFHARSRPLSRSRTTLFVAFSPTLQCVKRNSTHHRQSYKLLSPDAQSILLPQALKPPECQAQPLAAIQRQSCKKTRRPRLTQPKPHNNPHNQTHWRKTMSSRISR
jgi:hypothetical protein